MDDWFSFKSTTKGRSIAVDAKLGSDSAAGELTVSLEVTSGTSTTVTIKVDINSGTVTMLGIQSLSSLHACLAACAAGAILGPLIRCFNKNIKKYLACLKSKGLDTASDAVKCALACVAGGVSTGTP
jgi:hypothetical protein